jgi:TonB family protein
LPLIVGVATLALAGICAVVFFVHRRNAPVSDTKAAEVTQPTTSVPSPASNAPDAVQSPQVEPSQAAAQAQIQAQPVAVEEAHPVAAVSPIPAVVTGPAGTDSRTETRTETRNVPRQEKNAVAIKQADPSPSRRLAMTNLKIGSPSAPNQNLVNLSEGTAPIADISSTEAAGATPPAGLLTSAGRTSNPPVAPPSAPAPEPVARTFREPKLISSTQLVYPSAARQSNIQGSVTVSATIDANGNVIGAKALSGPLLLRQAAEGSVRQWKYSPALVDGKPATSQVSVSVEFRLR